MLDDFVEFINLIYFIFYFLFLRLKTEWGERSEKSGERRIECHVKNLAQCLFVIIEFIRKLIHNYPFSCGLFGCREIQTQISKSKVAKTDQGNNREINTKITKRKKGWKKNLWVEEQSRLSGWDRENPN